MLGKIARLGVVPTDLRLRQACLSTTALPPVPAKRRWLHGTDLVRGAVSLLVAPGARGKSSWLVTLALACASNQPLLGAKIFGGPLRVLLISAEDPLSELALRIRAAMQHHGLTDADVPGLYVIGADHWGVSLLRPATHGPILEKAGWDELNAELDHLEPDILIIDPLISVMGGASQNDNAAAALFMGQLIDLAAKRSIGAMVAHHVAKGRDPLSAESAMGAASYVNLSRIALGIEPLPEKDAGSLGLPPWEARHVFRLVSTKHNQSPPAEGDRWYRLRNVDMNNAAPPVYPDGDKVGVVEVFQPSASSAAFSAEIIKDTLSAIDTAAVPLSPSKRATGRYAVPVITHAMAPHRGGRASDTEAEAVLDYLMRTGFVAVQQVKLARAGGRSDSRNGLVLTSAGKQQLDAGHNAHSSSNLPAMPASPATSVRDDAGDAGARLAAPPQHKGGMGGNAGAIVAGAIRTEHPSSSHTSLPSGEHQVPAAAITEGAPANSSRARVTAQPVKAAPEPPVKVTEPAASPAQCPAAADTSTSPAMWDDLEIPDFLRRTQPATITLKVSSPLAASPCRTRARWQDRPKHYTGTRLNHMTGCRPHFRNSRRAVGRRPNRTLHHRFGSSLV